MSNTGQQILPPGNRPAKRTLNATFQIPNISPPNKFYGSGTVIPPPVLNNIIVKYPIQADSPSSSFYSFHQVLPSKVSQSISPVPPLLIDRTLGSGRLLTAGGLDYVVYDEGGILVPYQIRTFDIPTGRIVTYSKPAALGLDTYLQPNYTKASAPDVQNNVSLWSDFDAVYHFTNTILGPNTVLDQTGNNHNGSTVGSVTSVDGQLGKALNFDSNGDTTASGVDLGSTIPTLRSIDEWVLIFAGKADVQDDFNVPFAQASNLFFLLDGNFGFQNFGGGFPTIFSDGDTTFTDFFVAIVRHNGPLTGQTTLFFNGKKQQNDTTAIPNLSTGLNTKTIGYEEGFVNRTFDGIPELFAIAVNKTFSDEYLIALSNSILDSVNPGSFWKHIKELNQGATNLLADELGNLVQSKGVS